MKSEEDPVPHCTTQYYTVCPGFKKGKYSTVHFGMFSTFMSLNLSNPGKFPDVTLMTQFFISIVIMTSLRTLNMYTGNIHWYILDNLTFETARERFSEVDVLLQMEYL